MMILMQIDEVHFVYDSLDAFVSTVSGIIIGIKTQENVMHVLPAANKCYDIRYKLFSGFWV